MLLAELKPGDKAVIEHITDYNLSTKLFEMGCLPGEAVELCYSAPLGDPIAVRVAGYTLALRLAEAAMVEVRPI